MTTARTSRPGGAVRTAEPHDLPAVARLCAAHAAFEHAGPVPLDLAERLGLVLSSASPRASCLVADDGGDVVGYATWSLEFSTWRSASYVHLDCLFVVESHRDRGWGRALLAAVTSAARAGGTDQVQWQTPSWNADAIRFYARTGARGSAKVRFSLDL